MKFNKQYMESVFQPMLAPGEKSLCPIYCAFKQTGFLASSRSMIVGFVTLTSGARLLIAQHFMGRTETGFAYLPSVKKLKVSKNLFGQTVVEAVFPDGKKDFTVKFQAAPKIIGCDFPDQAENLNRLCYVLDNYRK